VNAVTIWVREWSESVMRASCPLPDRVRGEIAERAELERARHAESDESEASARNRTRRGRALERQIPLRSGAARITSAALPAISHESRNQ